MLQQIPMDTLLDNTRARHLGWTPPTDSEIMHRWCIQTGAHENGSRKPTPEEWADAAKAQAEDVAKWYGIGFKETKARFATMEDDRIVLNYWHFHRRAMKRYGAYEAGVRDACAILAHERGVVIPDEPDLPKNQRCICWECTHA